MLLPDKHIRLSESILGLSSFALERLAEPRTLDSLWMALRTAQEDKSFPAEHGIDNLVLAVAFLFSIGVIAESADGALARCD